MPIRDKDYMTIGDRLDHLLQQMNDNERLGYVLLVFPFNRPGKAKLVTNGDTKGIAKMLRGMADTIEKGELAEETPEDEDAPDPPQIHVEGSKDHLH